MTLRVRLLLSALALSLATTFVLSLVLRSAWKNAEASRFQEEFDGAVAELSRELSTQAAKIQAQIVPLCDHDPLVDSALVGLQSGTLNSRLLSLRARLPELAQALDLSELALVASDGTVIAGSTRRSEAGRELLSVVEKAERKPGFRREPPRAFEAACVRRDGDTWVALLAASHLVVHLERASQAHHLELALMEEEPGKLSDATLVAQVKLPALEGAHLVATRSSKPLFAQLRDLDLEVASAVLVTLAAASLFAVLLSRSLSGPVIAFANRTREAVTGRVAELPETGGPELAQAARAFNATLRDLRQLRQRLAATEKIAARREVARQVAHEIKNPLSPIRTSLETLRKLHARGHPKFDEYFMETSETMLAEVRRLTTMVAHFSEYAKLPSPSVGEVDLKTLVQEIVQLHQGLGARVSVELSDLPKVRADRDQVAQVLTNLIKNALEAAKESPEPRVVVTLSSDDPDRFQSIEVADNGPGVPETQLERLFEPYATTKRDGTGLGLPISHRIAVEHGGDLTYRKAQGDGARFVLWLPTHGPPDLAVDPET